MNVAVHVSNVCPCPRLREGVRKGRGTQSIRHLEMIDWIARNRYTTIDKLSAHFGVSTKTIRRDICVLQEAGIPVVVQPYLGEEPTTVRQNFIRITGTWSFIKKDGAIRMNQRGKCRLCATETNWAVEGRYWCGC